MKLDSKYFDKIRVKPSTDKKKAAEAVPQCDWPDCPRPGPHKAPMGRGHEGKFYNYCTAHVQEYNKSYNYFSGMKDDDVQEFQRNARLGERVEQRDPGRLDGVVAPVGGTLPRP